MLKIKNIFKLGIIVNQYRVPVHSICQLNNSMPKEIHAVFHNGSNYDLHFIKKELAEEFQGQFTCLGENTEKYITFSVPVEKEVKRIGKNLEETTKTNFYILQFIDSTRLMASLLSNLANNLAERIFKVKWEYGYDNENKKLVELNEEIVSVVLTKQTLKDDLIEYKCLCCNKNYQKKTMMKTLRK